METKNKRPRLLATIIILTIIGGTMGIIKSIPFFSLYTSIKQGGIIVNDKVSIQQVQPNTPASEAYLMKGDTIISINGVTITSSSDFVDISNANQGKEIIIVIKRNNSTQNVKLVPRVNPPPGEGKLGILLTDTRIEKKSTFKLVPQIIILSYSGFEEKPTLFSSTQVYQDKNLTRLQSLIFGIISIAIGIGLWKWKKWAFYGYLLSIGYGIVVSIPFLVNPTNYKISNQIQSLFLFVHAPNLFDTIIVIVGLVIELLFAYYIFRQKKLFR